MKRCKETVFSQRVQNWQCQRDAGYGPNGEYCKQHARKHESITAALTLWDLEIKFGDGVPKPIKAREATPSSYVDERGRRNNRRTEYHSIFDTKEEALEYAIKRAQNSLEYHEREVKAHEKLLKKLKGML